MTKIRIIDVAQLSGVSKSTVSQYLNGRFNHMAEATKERIEKAIKDLDYVPNKQARSLKTDKTNTIGLVVRDVSGFYTGPAIRAIDDYCKSAGYNVIIYNSDFDSHSERDALKALKAASVDGIIIAPSGKNMDLLDQYTRSGIPLVQFQIEYGGNDKDIVISDYFTGAFDATEYLIKLGYRKIFIFSQYYQGIISREQRIAGYRAALIKYNIPFNEDFIQIWDREAGFDNNIEKLFINPKESIAVFAQHLAITTDLLTYFEKYHISIPDDVSLVSFDDMPMADFFKVPITVVKQDPVKIGTETAKLLLKKIKNKNSGTEKVIIPCLFVTRKSCQSAK